MEGDGRLGANGSVWQSLDGNVVFLKTPSGTGSVSPSSSNHSQLAAGFDFDGNVSVRFSPIDTDLTCKLGRVRG